MPYNVGRPGTELDECNYVLAEIKTIISTYTPFNVIFAGDLNADMSRNNFQAEALGSFVTTENLYRRGILAKKGHTLQDFVLCISWHFSIIKKDLQSFINFESPWSYFAILSYFLGEIKCFSVIFSFRVNLEQNVIETKHL